METRRTPHGRFTNFPLRSLRRTRSRQCRRLFAAAITVALAAGICLSVPVTPPAQAQQEQSPNRGFNHVQVEDGLVSNVARALHQSADGVMWIGTLSGLSRFDGFSITNFTRDPSDPTSLPDNVVSALASDDQALWIGTVSGGLARLSFADTTIETYVGSESEGLPGPTVPVLAVKVDRGRVWLGLSTGLASFDPATESFETVADVEGPVNDLAIDPNSGAIWAGSGSGLYRVEPESGTIVHFTEGEGDEDLPSNTVTSVALAPDGTVWVGMATSGVASLSPGSDSFRQYRRFPGEEFDYFTLAILVASDGSVWTTSGSRLYNIDPVSGRSTRYAHDPANPGTIGSGAVLDVIEDRDGLIWVAKQDAGAAYLDPGDRLADWLRLPLDDPDAANRNRIFGATTLRIDDQPAVVVSTRDVPVRYDLATGVGTPLPEELAVCPIHAGDSGGSELWCVSDRVVVADLETGGVEEVLAAIPEVMNGRVWHAEVDESGLWLGGPAALVRVDRTGTVTDTYTADQLAPLGGVSTMARLGDGRLALGHWGSGLGVFDPETADLVHFGAQAVDDRPALIDPTVFDVVADESGVLYVATNGGLDIIAADLSSVERFNQANGLLATAALRGVAVSGQQVFVSHASGVSVVDRSQNQVAELTGEDGLQGLDFAPGAIDVAIDGTVVAGGAHGLNAFARSSFDATNRTSCSAGPSVSEVAANGSVVHRGPSELVSLPAGSTAVRVGFQHPCYSRQALAQLRYRLGADDAWTILRPGQNELELAGLSAGEHRFEIQAADRVGGWVDDTLTLTVGVDRFWYQKRWMQALLALLGIGLAAALVLRRLRRIRRQNEELARQVEERTAELAETNRSLEETLEIQRDTMDIVIHDLRAPVVRQMLHLGMTTDHPVIPNPALLRDQVEHMDRLLNGLMRVREAESRPDLTSEPVVLAGVVNQAIERAMPQARVKSITVTGPGEDQSPPLTALGDRYALGEILDNFLSNAVKYTEPGGEIEVRCDGTSDEFIECRVRDNGVGIAADDMSRLFTKFGRANARPTASEPSVGLGLYSASTLAEQMNGFCRLESDGLGQGSTAVLTIPRAGVVDLTSAVRTRAQNGSNRASQTSSASPLE